MDEVIEFNKKKTDGQYKYIYVVELSDGYMVRLSQVESKAKNIMKKYKFYDITKLYKPPEGWKYLGNEGELVFWETKRRSKIYKGQSDKDVYVSRHPLNKNMWTVNYGQAPISMPKYMYKRDAIEGAMDYMKMWVK